ncbi:MAG: Catabolite control protein A [Candidatus Celerinatantimonas neptuna]|nr:MAG: Catabolite control protein A [Candidatus Celerinatantimonas neptuna]
MTTHKHMASAAEVAKLAGVSRSAVSRTFTPGSSVSQRTRKKVMMAAEALDYHVNHLARGLSKAESRPVCILGANLNSPFQARLLDILTQQLQQNGRAVMVINTAGGDESSDAALKQTLNYRAAATIVLTGTPHSSLIETCIQSGQQVILVNRAGQFTGAEHITLDYSSAMCSAHHTLQQAGCRRLAVISSTIRSPSLLTREKLFMQAAEQAEQPCELLRAGPTRYETGCQAARQLMAQHMRPDGIFCVTDLIACGFIDTVRHEFGLNIPEDLCVIGFDNIEQAGWLGYQLTTYEQPLQDMVDAILERLQPSQEENRDLKISVFHAKPIWRKTVRKR